MKSIKEKLNNWTEMNKKLQQGHGNFFFECNSEMPHVMAFSIKRFLFFFFYWSWTSIFLTKKKTDGAVYPLRCSLMGVTSLLCGRSLTDPHNPFIVTATLDLPTMRPTSQWRSSKPQVIMVPTVSLTTDTMSMSKSCNENLFIKTSFHLNSLLLASKYFGFTSLHFILFNLLNWNQSLSFYEDIIQAFYLNVFSCWGLLRTFVSLLWMTFHTYSWKYHWYL